MRREVYLPPPFMIYKIRKGAEISAPVLGERVLHLTPPSSHLTTLQRTSDFHHFEDLQLVTQLNIVEVFQL